MERSRGCLLNFSKGRSRDNPIYFHVLTNGKYNTVEHRAMINPNKERLSIATFHLAKDDGRIERLLGILKGGKENFVTWSYIEYQKAFLAAKLDGANILEKMKTN
ncbi:hypothetical protein ZIOFF_047714 [Zingiber officinale]|uniref:Isopenicillin N synthase-like Fe(2+) 2OG dioxygenase domain-containing protein n=1 Tax=Zingiber officinale TaxID=94328 RepID=A0A8J5FR97_ZINOF|nr:hypothetical protein ZIOFF_047714 [Zingiber officinale]